MAMCTPSSRSFPTASWLASWARASRRSNTALSVSSTCSIEGSSPCSLVSLAIESARFERCSCTAETLSATGTSVAPDCRQRHDAVAPDVDDRLVMHFELAGLQRGAQAGLDRDALLQAPIHRRAEEL